MDYRAIIQVTIITFKEALKQRVLHGVFIAALLIIVFSISICGLFLSDILKVLLDICLTSASLGGLLVPFFITIKLFSEDLDNRTIYSLLSRPITRASYIIGRFFGLSILSGTIMMVLAFASFITVYLATFIYPPHFFINYSPPAILISFYTSFIGILILNSVVLLWCSLSTTSFLATLLTIATYIIGHSTEDISRFIDSQHVEAPISPIIKHTIQTCMFIFPNLEAFNTKHYAAHGLIISVKEFIYLNIYGLTYTASIIILTILIFKRRDL